MVRPSLRGPFFARLLVLSCSPGLAGCTTNEKALPGSKYVVTAPKTQFYKYGPAQTFGADFQLNKDQPVTMIERSFGYSRVMTGDGITGYVPSEDLKLAPPDPVSRAATPAKFGGLFSGKPKRSNVQPTPGSPLFDTSDLPPAPLPDKPSPKPRFRF